MGKMKETIMEEDQWNPQGQMTQEEFQASQQEQYYWHLLHEFVAINKYFGQTKVMADLKMIRERLKAEEDKDKPRIQLI